MGVEFCLSAACFIYEEYVVYIPVCMFSVLCVKYECLFDAVHVYFGEYA